MDDELVKAFKESPQTLIRNICIVGHVDHGKTTLTDFLISSCGIISARQAGKLRYMDNREDEQIRGITMKSSAISLYYDPVLINLVDSPGHIDFCTEVYSAVNLTDIALLIIDAVEGVLSQTELYLRLALKKQLDVILIINKIDRLVVELNMTESEAFRHLRSLIENVNSFISQTIQGEMSEEEWHKLEAKEKLLHFDPVKGTNVIFASALHGYAFSLADFSKIWSDRLGLENQKILPYLFSPDYYFSSSAKKINECSKEKPRKPIFEQLVLEPIWEIHKSGLVDKNLNMLNHMATKLSLTHSRSKRPEEAFDNLMHQWLPLATPVVRACAYAKSAKNAFASRDRLLQLCTNEMSPLYEFIRLCDPQSPVLIFALKFFKIDERQLALCRVMSGTVMKGQTLCVFSPMNKRTDRTSQIKDIGILIGKEILSTDQAPCGRICALEFEDGWVDGNILFSKQIDLSDLKNCLNFEVNQRLTEPIVRVTIRPSSGGNERVQELKNCLKQLTVLDSAVRVVEQEDGDLALITAGEIHLQKCLEDLKALGQTETSVSEPIVPFLETIVPELSVPLNKALLDHITECNLRLHSIKFTLRSVPLSAEIIQILAENSYLLDALQENENATNNSSEINQLRLKIISSATATLPKLKGTWWFKRNPAEIEHLFTNIWAFGPSRAKLNIFFDHSTKQGKDSPASNFGIHNCIWNSNLRQIEQTIVAGFHLAMSHGPLCDEPIQGVGVILEDFVQAPQPDTDSTHYLYGQLISAVRQTIRASLQKHPLRLLAAMYKCTVQTTAQTLGKVQSVLAQRRAKVILEDVNEATSLFEITSHMPVIESFSFCENLRKRTSGNASAHLEFSHWQLIDEDPYWEPKTEEEIEEFGVGKGCVNQARAYVIQVRKRKGLPTDELIVVNAEKQRNLKRNK